MHVLARDRQIAERLTKFNETFGKETYNTKICLTCKKEFVTAQFMSQQDRCVPCEDQRAYRCLMTESGQTVCHLCMLEIGDEDIIQWCHCQNCMQGVFQSRRRFVPSKKKIDKYFINKEDKYDA